MGVITISLNEETEKLLRTIAQARFANAKGKIARAITESLNEWAEKRKDDSIAKSLEMLRKGVKLGKIKGRREDWHDR